MNAPMDLSRRSFLKLCALAGGGLALGVYVPAFGRNGPGAAIQSTAPKGPLFAPNAFVQITPDNVVTIIVGKSEMGQGVLTALPMLVADELDADWDRVRLIQAPAANAYKNPHTGMQSTGGSSSVSSSWEPLREAGAAARAMLMTAAARQWGVAPDQVKTAKGVVHGPGGKTLSYGQVATAAAKLPVPPHPHRKAPRDYILIGRPVPRTDTPSKTNGTAQFGIDVRVPGMLIATVAHSPVFGGKVKHYDAAKAKAVPGVKAVVPVANGVAVTATDYWSAHKGLQAMPIQWDAGPNAGLSSALIHRRFATAVKKTGARAERKGDAAKALPQAAKRIEAVYEAPFAAHATMEPMNCTAHVHGGGCEVWVPTQNQTGVQQTAAKIAGVPQDKVVVHTTQLGGGFGRRFEQDFVSDAVRVSKALGAPVKLIWSREEDMTHDYYRPAAYSVLRGGIGKDGLPVAWTQRIVAPSILSRVMPGRLHGGIDPSAVEGAVGMPYAVPNVEVDYVMENTAVPVGFWRSVGNSYTAFMKEGFLDELAHAAGQDPYQYRRKLLSDAAPEMAVLELAADKAGWGKPLPRGWGRGIAVHKSFGSTVAEVVEVSVDPRGHPRVHRVVCAFDCGTVVNPDIVKAQAESAIIYGLTGALKGPITLDQGRVQQSNFNNYPMLRMNEAPAIEVYLVDSHEAPTGVGEPAVPPLAPALANALFAATGKRVRRLPITARDLRA